MFSSTFLTLIVIPVFYLVFEDAADALKRALRRLGSQTRHQASPATP
jgi:hypothetical protein